MKNTFFEKNFILFFVLIFIRLRAGMDNFIKKKAVLRLFSCCTVFDKFFHRCSKKMLFGTSKNNFFFPFKNFYHKEYFGFFLSFFNVHFKFFLPISTTLQKQKLFLKVVIKSCVIQKNEQSILSFLFFFRFL